MSEIKKIRIAFDGPPAPHGCEFVEVEDESGKGIKVGEWKEQDGFWYLYLPDHRELNAALTAAREEVEEAKGFERDESERRSQMYSALLRVASSLNYFDAVRIAEEAIKKDREL